MLRTAIPAMPWNRPAGPDRKGRKTRGALASVAASCLVALTLTHPAPAQDAEPVVMRMAHYQPEQRVLMQAIQWWSDELEKRTDGKIKVQHYFSGQLASAREILPLIRQGGLDLGTPALAYHASEFPLTQIVVDYPWGTLDELLWAVPKLIAETPVLKEEWERNNVVPLSYGALPPYGMATTEPVASLDDLEGCKVRVWGEYIPMKMLELGMVPVTMPSSETYEAMAKGTVNCTLSPPDQHRSLGLDEVAKHHVVGDFAPALLAAQPMMNARKFNEMDPELQQVFRDLQADHLTKLKELIHESDDEDRAFLKENGVEFTELSAAENERLQKASVEVWEELADRNDNQEAVAKIKKAIEDVSAAYREQN